MAGQDLSGFDKALKDVYGPRIEEQLNNVNPLTDVIEEDDSQDWTGRQKIYPIHVGRNEGVGASAEGDPLPSAGAQSYAEVRIPCRFNHARIQLTIQVIKQSQSSKGAFVRAMDAELKGAAIDLANDRERQFFGNGKGVLALVNGQQNFNATTTMVVDSPFGVTPTTNGARFLNPGMKIVAIDPTTDTTIEGTFTVSSVATAGTSIVLSATQNTTISDNARLVRWKDIDGTGAKNSINKEVTGLLGLLDDGTYVATLHNVSRTTYPVFKSPVISSVGSLSTDVIQRAIDASDQLGGGNFGSNGYFFADYSVRREYLKLLEPDRRYTGADLRSPDAGTKQAALKRAGEITYGDRPFKIAKACPYATIFGLLKGAITRHILVRGEWADEDGSVLKWKPDYDIWQGFYRIFDELHTDRPNNGFRLDGITATVVVNHNY